MYIESLSIGIGISWFVSQYETRLALFYVHEKIERECSTKLSSLL